MTTSQTGVLLCRIVALFLVLRAIESVAIGLPMAIPTGHLLDYLLAAPLIVGTPLVGAAILWYLAPRLSTFESAADDTADQPARDFLLLVSAGVLLIGLYALLFGIIDLVRVELGFWAQAHYRPEGIPLTPQELANRWPARATYVLKIVFGFLLVVGRDSVARYFRYLRHAGLGPMRD